MKVYISGKMRGMPEAESRKLFKAAEQYLQQLGHDTVNPWDNELEKEEACEEWADYIIFDLPILKTCDAIFMLGNWMDSWGARVEYAFARGCGMEVIYEKPIVLQDELLEKAFGLLLELTENDPSFMCEKIMEEEGDDYCSENCENFDKNCLMKYLKHYEKDGTD